MTTGEKTIISELLDEITSSYNFNRNDVNPGCYWNGSTVVKIDGTSIIINFVRKPDFKIDNFSYPKFIKWMVYPKKFVFSKLEKDHYQLCIWVIDLNHSESINDAYKLLELLQEIENARRPRS